ncbi:MAG: phosphate signaling complex protein PhoU [Pyramidobacter sp.]|nr:phosphate signaling complex protein PhoU [Pyramidobacter sp.]
MSARSAKTKEESLESYLYASDKARMKVLVVQMTDFARQAFLSAVKALNSLDMETARSVMANDDAIDDLEEQIDQECLYSIAMRQPMREDLRFVYAVMKIITDIERIGDQAVNISGRLLKYVEITGGKSPVPKLEQIQEMGDRCDAMLADFLESFDKEDSSILERMRENRHCVAEIGDEAVSLLIQRLASPYLIETPMEIFCAIWIIRHIGRVADHLMNLAEKVYFIGTGISPMTLKRRTPEDQRELPVAEV